MDISAVTVQYEVDVAAVRLNRDMSSVVPLIREVLIAV